MSESVNWCYCWASGPHWVGLCSSLHKYGFSQFYILIGCPRQKCVLCYKNGWKQHSEFEWFKSENVKLEKSSAMCKCAMWDLKLKWIRSIFYSHVQSHTLNNPYVCTTNLKQKTWIFQPFFTVSCCHICVEKKINWILSSFVLIWSLFS